VAMFKTRNLKLCGQVYRSERDAVLSIFDHLHATQIDAALAFAKWAVVCRTPGLRAGLVLIAERNSSHARALERRAREIGGQRILAYAG
jgi:hypothetical protein